MPNMINNNINGLNSFLLKINEIMLFNKNLNTNLVENSQFWWVNNWFYTYNSLISLTFMITVIFLIGLILPKTPKGVSTLNVLSAFSIILFLFFLPVPHYNVVKHLIWFDYSLYVYLYILIGGIFTASFLAINNEITFLKENKHIEYPLLILLVFLFGIVVVASENFIAVFLGLEAITLVSAVLIGFQRTNNFSTLAGIRYILFSAVPGGALLLGISELYAYTGAFNFADIEKLLMNYNESSIDNTTLNNVGQVLFNTLDMVLYYNWDNQFDFYKESLINLNTFIKNSNNEFNNLIISSKETSTVLEQVINYEFDNSYKENLEPITLSLLGSYILQDNTNFDDNIKVGKYYIYKYISMNNYNNYSNTFLKNDQNIIDYLTVANKPNYADPMIHIDNVTDIEAIRKDKSFKEFAITDKLIFFINFEDAVCENAAAKKYITELLGQLEEKKVLTNFLNDGSYDTQKAIIKNINPVFYNEILNLLDLNVKKKVWSSVYAKVFELIGSNEFRTGVSDSEYITNFLMGHKDSLESKIKLIQNELNYNSFDNFKYTSFEHFQNNYNNESSTLNSYFYSILLEKLNLVNHLIKKIESGEPITAYFLDFLSENESNNSLFIDLLYDFSGKTNPNITNYDELINNFGNRMERLDENINNIQSLLKDRFNVDFNELKSNPNYSRAEEILIHSKFYHYMISIAFDKIYPALSEQNFDEKQFFFKVEILSNNSVNLHIIDDYKSDISSYLFNKDITIKKDILNLVSVNHNYNLPTIINIAIFLIIFYILFKLTAAPFHIWAPSIYEGAPLPVTIFLSVFSKITMIFLLIKLLVFYFYFLYSEWSTILLFSGVASIIVGIYGAISETRIKRFFVYSSMGHVGFMLLGISEGGVHGVLATVIYLMIYTVTVFIGWTILFASEQKVTHINQLSGLSKTNPTLSFILAISMLSMSGIPPLAGFYVKFEILYSLVESEYYNVALLALLLTVFSFFYYLRIIKILYFEPVKKFKLQYRLNKTQAFLLAVCFLFLINFSLYFQQPIIYILKNIIIQSIY